MPKIDIKKQKCKGCELCILYCPCSCIELDKALNKKGVHSAVFSEKDKACTGCSFCAIICPDGCIEVYKT